MQSFFKTIFFALTFSIIFAMPAKAANYPFTAVVSGSSIIATMTGVPNDSTQYLLYNGNTPVGPNNTAAGITPIPQGVTNGTVVWTVSGLAFVNGTYNLHVEKVPTLGQTTIFGGSNASNIVTATVPVTVTAGGIDFFAWPLSVTTPTGQTIVLGGKIDTSLYPNVGGLQVKLEYSTSTTLSTPALAFAHSSLGATSIEGVASDGSYYFELNSLAPTTKYYYRQTISIKSTNTVLSTKNDASSYFDSTAGYIVTGSTAEQNAEAPYTYHLLAPWPGLSTLLDPALCAQKKAEHKIPQSSICDINGFINFAFKTLIGLTAVILVLRLIYEGYQYMVTDVPFLKASAKSGFFTALMGLLLALSSYLILNTINPKLVENSINVNGVNVSVEDPTTFTSGGGAYTAEIGATNLNTNINAYDTFLHASATAFGIDYALAKAHMYAESSGKPNAMSTFTNKKTGVVGHAYGLMQLSKETFEGMGYNFSMIYDPKTNIEAGIKYMSKLKSIGCDGTTSNAICTVSNTSYRVAAYNGGPVANRVSETCSGQTRWQCSSNGGYLETRKYVPIVLAYQQKITQNNW